VTIKPTKFSLKREAWKSLVASPCSRRSLLPTLCGRQNQTLRGVVCQAEAAPLVEKPHSSLSHLVTSLHPCARVLPLHRPTHRPPPHNQRFENKAVSDFARGLEPSRGCALGCEGAFISFSPAVQPSHPCAKLRPSQMFSQPPISSEV
jgi:hypothetical protein